jgi:hypothetical protein
VFPELRRAGGAVARRIVPCPGRNQPLARRVTLELNDGHAEPHKPEVEAGLEAHAHASGMSLQEYLLSVVEEAAAQADSFRHRSIARRVAQTGSPTPLQAGNSRAVEVWLWNALQPRGAAGGVTGRSVAAG